MTCHDAWQSSVIALQMVEVPMLYGLNDTETNKILIDILNKFMTLTKIDSAKLTHFDMLTLIYYYQLQNKHLKHKTEALSGRATHGFAAVCNPLMKIKVYIKKMVKRRLASLLGHTKDHSKNGTNCLPAWHAGFKVGVSHCSPIV